MAEQSRILAVLGPTNTGKTHYAIERMLGYRTGVIGLPLRLLAREVYDRIVRARGPSVVALVTGEERIVPPRTQYWVCTVEAMPEGIGADFVAVDEIQLCADRERGHVFTDRLLRMRGLRETQFLGAATMRGMIRALVPEAEFIPRERMSQLVYSGSKKISKLPARTAIVGFSVENVYAIAELLRRQKGGAAVVMGALSPRTRNAQVEMYQRGEVDYLVATDAIGMGLNLDITHVAFSALSKFDGRRMRALMPHELAQIAGRAGRGMTGGTFGVTGDAPPLADEVAQAIMDHRFAPVRKLEWRNADLSLGSIEALIASLEKRPGNELLARAQEADDLSALRTLAEAPEVRARATDGAAVRLLWDVCRIPDFRGISQGEHAGLLETIFCDLHDRGQVPDDWLARQIRRIDRTDGDIDALSKRLAYIRTWTYVAQRSGWVADESHWRAETRAVEDRLSDALHGALTQRFVDRRTAVLLRRLKQKEAIVAEVNDKGEVTVEGEFVGRLEGFRFLADKSATGQEARTLNQASLQALAPHFHLRADRFYNAPDTEIDFTEQGGLMWGSSAVGKLVKGSDPLKPAVKAFVDEEAGAEVAQKVERRLQHFIDRKIATLFEPLLALSKDETLTGLARGFAFRMVEGLGVTPRGEVADEVKALDQDARGALRKHGVRFGQFTIFMPLLLKPAPTRLRLVLWALAGGFDDFPEAPPPGLVTVPAGSAPQGYYTMAGYRAAGARAIRIDMLERLADMLRAQDSRGGFEATPDMLSITGMTLEQFADLMQGLGYKAERGEREKVKPVDVAIDDAPAQTAPVDAEAVQPETPAETAETIEDAGEAPVVADPAEEAEVPADIPEASETEILPGAAPDEDRAPEIESFYTFTWAGRPRRGGAAPEGRRGKPQGKGARKSKGKPRGDGAKGPKTASAKPAPKKDRIDPDNPFAAALMGLKDKS
ncbi:disulfide oxidoreductase [Roseovarius spongiae]|uniref:Disulfide oxidoreductase n=1 Tax=Roseovarius spongiae TaxID=2320272 RepID=A0A3A8B9E7_9RHOB|nr:helicase-related protein [Roseovarius spongiae]RKF14845.1 disulfide oxidoreductase [Roseovarius spongiae]